MAFETTTELAEFVEKELGHNLTGPSSQRDDIISHLDRANKIVHAGGGFLNFDQASGKRISEDVEFSFARSSSPKVLTLLPLVNSSITATQFSNVVSFSSAPSASSCNSWHVQVQGENTVYRIASHVGGATSAVLDGDYVDANCTSATCGVGKLQYVVGSGDILGLISPVRLYGGSVEVEIVDEDEMLQRCPVQMLVGSTPEYAACVNENAGNVTLQFSSAPDTDYIRAEIDYLAKPTTLSASVDPTMPGHYRELLAHLALYFMQIRNDDDRANTHFGIAQMMFKELVAWNRKFSSRGDRKYGRVVLSKKFGYVARVPYVASPV